MRLRYQLIIIFVLLLLVQLGIEYFRPVQVQYRSYPKTDTVKVKKITEPVVKQAVPPKKVVLAMVDTTRRKAAERGTILRGIELKRDLLHVHSITPEGISQVTEFPDIPIAVPIVIDSAGNVGIDEKELKRIRRKEKWRKIGNKVIVAGAFVAGIALAAAVQ